MTSNTLIGIAKKVREVRLEKGLKLIEVAKAASVSKGLLSKIENGRTIPSLPVLLKIIQALKVDLTVFFEGIEDGVDHRYIHCKPAQHVSLQKEDSVGFNYFSILQESFNNIALHVAILDLDPEAEREKVITDGYQLLYLLDGKIDYELDNESVFMEAGDSLFFNGQIPHVPRNNSNERARILVIYLLTTNKSH
ncbi:helix-turn-helix domain-containing protein [Puteibacter caeruleilacunae]|nr:helix-turn-helix domain-containing protein [Puteibacter caeruleilacunae]